MANLTLAQELKEVNAAISAGLLRESYTTSTGITYKAAELNQLRLLRREIIDNINAFGANYIMGQDIEPTANTSYASFN